MHVSPEAEDKIKADGRQQRALRTMDAHIAGCDHTQAKDVVDARTLLNKQLISQLSQISRTTQKLQLLLIDIAMSNISSTRDSPHVPTAQRPSPPRDGSPYRSVLGERTCTDLLCRTTMSATITTYTQSTLTASPKKIVQQTYGKLRKKYKFIPRDLLDKLLDEETVRKILHEIAKSKYQEGPLQIDHFEPETVFRRIHRDYRIILAILIDLSWEETIVEFSRFDNLNDSKLPFNEEQLRQVDERLIETEFSKRQYYFIVEALRKGHAWGMDYVLPFVEDTSIGTGGFSEVYRIKIYPKYDELTLPNDDSWADIGKLKKVCR